MNTEGFFRNKGDKLIFAGHASVGANNAVDCTAIHQRVSEHFYAGDGLGHINVTVEAQTK